MEIDGSEKDMIVTQASFGGFGRDVAAKELTNFLEDRIGGVWKCRVKTSWTPPESYPDFNVRDMEKIKKTDNYEKVEPHAFVHFVLPESAQFALDSAGKCDLFCRGKALKVSLGPQNPFRLNQMRRTTTPFRFTDVRLEVGVLKSRNEFLVGWKGPDTGLEFLIDSFDGSFKFIFTRDTAFAFKGTYSYSVMRCNYKVEFSVGDVNEVREYRDLSCLILFLVVDSSPVVSYRTADDDIEESASFDLLDDDDPWIRTTDFTLSGVIGRCNSYRLSIPPRFGMKLKRAVEYLKKMRIQHVSPLDKLRVWDEPDYGIATADPFFYIHKEGLPFEILFILNAAMHKGIINQHALSDGFFNFLRSHPKDISVAALKQMCSYHYPVYNAEERLSNLQEWFLKNPELIKNPVRLDEICEVRRVVITPTRAYCIPPEVELSNRVLRHYREHSDRFLRVTFMDEGMRTMNSNVLNYFVASIVREITSNSYPQKTNVFRRIRSILTEGFFLCGRRYAFLAFSSNQLRDRSAWFFAEGSNLTVANIRGWMGRFTNRNIAKCAARMGQCFSSTYAAVEVPQSLANMDFPDIERNGYVFSDGIGTISPELSNEVAGKLRLPDNPPCAYQIRYAGFKGVVACWPSKDPGIRMYLRPSMNKFQSAHNILEICSWTRFQPGFLNRQIVTLLSALGVPDDVFWKMQEDMIYKLDKMLTDTETAFDVLTTSCADQGHAAAIMLSAGFVPKTEPHLRGMLSCIRSAQFWGLREKARIFDPEGRWLMGCLDELGVLEQGQCFVQVSSPSLENCFSKHGGQFSERKENLRVIEGYVVIAKNPCLHPGDVRILQAVDVPGLHHLYDCLIFPQKGDRPHTNEASGSDLDGDLYFVTWNENLIPPGKKSWTPMDYAAVESKLLSRDVNQQDLIEFFVRNMVNEHLGTICNSHVVHADLSEQGAFDENCLELAKLAAGAVDFPKTGVIVTMPHHLKPKLYPDFMGKEIFQTYQSTKILGRLYRRINHLHPDDAPDLEPVIRPEDVHYDQDLNVPGSADFVSEAWERKCWYDEQLGGLLRQYKVKREEEVVTGHVWSMPKYNSRKQGDLKERLKQAFGSLQKELRQVFEKIEGESEDKNVLYERKASAWYRVSYHPDWVKAGLGLQSPAGSGKMVLLSFPWAAVDYLARIKVRSRGVDGADLSKGTGSLAKYIYDRL